MKRTIGNVALATAMLAGVVTLGLLAPEPGGVRETGRTSVTCAEDDPCWDCHTMGNRVCGGPTVSGLVVPSLPGGAR